MVSLPFLKVNFRLNLSVWNTIELEKLVNNYANYKERDNIQLGILRLRQKDLFQPPDQVDHVRRNSVKEWNDQHGSLIQKQSVLLFNAGNYCPTKI